MKAGRIAAPWVLTIDRTIVTPAPGASGGSLLTHGTEFRARPR